MVENAEKLTLFWYLNNLAPWWWMLKAWYNHFITWMVAGNKHSANWTKSIDVSPFFVRNKHDVGEKRKIRESNTFSGNCCGNSWTSCYLSIFSRWGWIHQDRDWSPKEVAIFLWPCLGNWHSSPEHWTGHLALGLGLCQKASKGQ